MQEYSKGKKDLEKVKIATRTETEKASFEQYIRFREIEIIQKKKKKKIEIVQ